MDSPDHCTFDQFSGIRIAINQVEYSNSPDGPVIHIFGRDVSGTAHQLDVTGFRPYFFALSEHVARRSLPQQATLEPGTEYLSIRHEKVRKIYTQKPGDVRDVRDRYKHFEADIPFSTRFMIDTGLTGGVSTANGIVDYHEISKADVDAPARFCIIDIECEDERGFPDPRRDAIICITCYDSFDEDYTTFLLAGSETSREEIEKREKGGGIKNGCFGKKIHTILTFTSEIEMMKGFTFYLSDRDPDILSGWNFTDFDMPYITGRMEWLGLHPDSLARLPGMTERNALRGRALFDLLTAYKKMHLTQKDSYRLDAIAMVELGEQKLRYTGTISDLWRKNPVTLVEYNFKDVELCVGINQKDDIIGFFREIARYVGCPLDRTLNSSNVIDVYVLKKAHGKYVLPSKGFVKAEEFEGATVFEPSKGARENVIVLDLKSLYPMAMMTINASIETKDPNGELRAPNGIRFVKSPDGLARGLISELLKERDDKKATRNTFPFGSREYKMYDMQQNVVKVIMNTYYGVSGYSRFRLFDQEIGSAVTSVGRAIIEHTRKVIEGMGYKVIYGDSVGKDSLIRIYRGKHFDTIKISDLFDQSIGCGIETDDYGKERIRLNNVYTDTVDSNGDVVTRRVPYIIRHKIAKKMYRVHLGYAWHVDVTEDHSLICYSSPATASEAFSNPNFFEAKPNDAMSNYLVTRQGSRFEIVRLASLEEIPYDDYVYDIEVEGTHRFFANNILVHNTDSCMVQLPPIGCNDTIAIARTIEKALNESYPVFAKTELNADTHYFSIKFEKIYARFFQAGKKKRYAGRLVWKEGKDVNETDIVGFEMKRSDTSQVAKMVQKKVMEQILDGANYDEIKAFLGGVIKKFRAGEYSLDEIGIPGGLGKGLDEYDHDDSQVRGAKYANQYLGTEFGKGSKPKRIYIKTVTSKYPRTDVLCFEYADQVPPEFVVDWELMLEKTIKQPISRVIEALGWDWLDIDPSRTTLAQWGFG